MAELERKIKILDPSFAPPVDLSVIQRLQALEAKMDAALSPKAVVAEAARNKLSPRLWPRLRRR